MSTLALSWTGIRKKAPQVIPISKLDQSASLQVDSKATQQGERHPTPSRRRLAPSLPVPVLVLDYIRPLAQDLRTTSRKGAQDLRDVQYEQRPPVDLAIEKGAPTGGFESASACLVLAGCWRPFASRRRCGRLRGRRRAGATGPVCVCCCTGCPGSGGICAGCGAEPSLDASLRLVARVDNVFNVQRFA